MSKTKRPSPISASNIDIPASIRFLSLRVMKELVTSGAVTNYVISDMEKLRIVITKGMAIAHRIGVGVGQSESWRDAKRKFRDAGLPVPRTKP